MGVKVHLLKQHASPAGNFSPGRTIEVSNEEADALVNAGAAERIDGMQPYVVEVPVKEKATEKKAETRRIAADK